MGGRWTIASIAIVCAIGYAGPSHGEVPNHNPNLDHNCPEGQQWSRGTVGCEQANCPAGSTRSYTLDCLCREPVPQGCYENGMTVQCLPAGSTCKPGASGFDPVTGGCKTGYATGADGGCVATSTTSGDPGGGRGDDDDDDGDGDGDGDDDDGDDDDDDDDEDEGDEGCEYDCPTGQVCHELNGECVDDPCVDMREAGCCAGEEMRFCVEDANWGVGEVAGIDCAGASECGWNADKDRYACVAAGTGAADPSGDHDMVCPDWCTVDPPALGDIPGEGAVSKVAGSLGRSISKKFQMPEFSSCFNETVELGFGYKKGGLNKPCSLQLGADGSASVCTTAFCTSECTTVTVSGGYDLTYDKVCNSPPEYECGHNYCEKKSGSISLEKSYEFDVGTLEFGKSGKLSSKSRPGTSIAFFKKYADCGLKLKLAGSVVASYTAFDGSSCTCKNGGSALTGRGVATFSGVAGCSLYVFGKTYGLPKLSVEGCMNAGLVADIGECVPDEQTIGDNIVGGGAVKISVPKINLGWFTVNAANVAIEWPAGRSTGCSGVTDL